MIQRIIGSGTALAAALRSFRSAAQAQTVKIAYIDPLSGAFANVGEAGLKQFQFVADDINKRKLAGGPKLEIVAFDNKVSPQESAERAEAGDRPGHPLHHPGQRLVGRRRADRRGEQAQRAQSRTRRSCT